MLASRSITCIRPTVAIARRNVAGRTTRSPPAVQPRASTEDAIKMPIFDPSSQSSYPTTAVTHVAFDVDVNFDDKVISGTATASVTVESESSTLTLDTRDLHIERVQLDGADLTFVLGEVHPVMGAPLVIELGTRMDAGTAFDVVITYRTSPSSSAVQWLRPEQTAGGTHPYLFTQCQAIHARSLFPCQDTPGAKMTYSAKVTAPDPLTALISAIPLGEPADVGDGKRCFEFEQRVPIPPYLLALAVGNVEAVEIGPRSKVWSEPEMVQAGAFEFAETEDFLKAAEQVAGPYVWGRYDLLLLPPSFPYGGMENPCLTFVTPTLLAGDRSQAHVVAHEIAHSWSGNLVTNKTWEHFWLNEGFTVFIERKIMNKMYGKSVFDFNAIGGLMELKETVARLGESHPHSKVPYEKGFAFLVYLEHVTRGGGDGPEHADAANGTPEFAEFLIEHFKRHQYNTVDTDDFKTAYTARFPEASAIVDWDAWLTKPGMPPVDVGLYYDGGSSEASAELARRWHLCDVLGMGGEGTKPVGASADDVKDFSSAQIDHFLLSLIEYRGGSHALSVNVVKSLDDLYGVSAMKNSEIRCKWLQLRLAAGDAGAFEPARDMLTSQGRMKFLRPLYRSLSKSKAEGGVTFARETFTDARNMYHPIAEKMVASDLGM